MHFAMARLIAIMVVLLHAIALWGQSIASYEQAADKARLSRDHQAAVQYYAIVLERRPQATDVWWKYGESALAYNAFDLAKTAYEQVAKLDPTGKKYPFAPLRLAQVARQQGKYEEALQQLEDMVVDSDARVAEEINQLKIACQWAVEQLKSADKPRIIHLDKKVNSAYSDFAPYMLGDTLYFSSYRFDQRASKSKPKPKTTKLLRALPQTSARPPGRGFPDADSVHIAHTAFYGEGAFLIFNQCKATGKGDIQCALWLTLQDRNGRWLKPIYLPEPVNIPGYTSTQPAIGFDSLRNGPVLYFASDRPGGKGGLDLWSVPLDTFWFCPCNRPLDSRRGVRAPTFDHPPTPLAALNTPGNDATPFFHDATQTLYFSSDARLGFGGYDIYASEKIGDDWLPVRNLGPGVNTGYNDLYYFLGPDGFEGMLSSNRLGSMYLDPQNKACCNDLYTVQWPRPVRDPEFPEKPEAYPPLEPPASNVPEAPERLFEQYVGLPLYFDNDEPDPRTRRTQTRKHYEETVVRYLEAQETYRVRFSEGLRGARKDVAEAAVDVFFEEEVRQGWERLSAFADLLLQQMQSGQHAEILIKGYTSPRAQSDYNINLGHRRVRSVINFFERYGNGALKSYMDQGALRISETSFGETQAAKTVSDDLEDRRNSVYHPDAARERRVEIVSIRVIR
jgi:outer membrane protein OmpA-like peptidoglycan-associated protein/tetratricopeptide (TPR) repeat protein